MKTKTITKENIAEGLEEFFKENKISAILYIPTMGTMSLITSLEGKLRVLEHASIEIRSEEVAKEIKAQEWAHKKLSSENHMGIEKKKADGLKYVG